MTARYRVEKRGMWWMVIDSEAVPWLEEVAQDFTRKRAEKRRDRWESGEAEAADA